MKKKLVIFDMDGTIYLGKNLFDGALETFDFLNKKTNFISSFLARLKVNILRTMKDANVQQMCWVPNYHKTTEVLPLKSLIF